MIGYHGETKGPIQGPPRMPWFLGYDKGLAHAYGMETYILEVEFEPANPLVLDSGNKFIEAWRASRAAQFLVPFYECALEFCEWAKARGHDAVLIPPEGFDRALAEDDHQQWEWLAGYFGDPQIMVLDPAIIRRVERVIEIGGRHGQTIQEERAAEPAGREEGPAGAH